MTGALDSLAANNFTVATCHTVTAKRKRLWRLSTPRPLQFLLREKPFVLTIPLFDHFAKSVLTALAHAAIAATHTRHGQESPQHKEFGKVALFDMIQDRRKVTIQALFSLPKALEQCKTHMGNPQTAQKAIEVKN